MDTNIRHTSAAKRTGKLLAIAAAAAFALQASAAGATTLIWSYTGPGPNSGSGTIEGTLLTSGPYAGGYSVDSISGTANGQTITGVDTFDLPDNVVYPPSPPNVGVDTNGFSFDAGGVQYNLYEDFGNFDTPPFACGAVYCLISSTSDTVALTDFTVSLAPAGVPEPASWAMLILGFGGIGAALRSRHRMVAAAA